MTRAGRAVRLPQAFLLPGLLMVALTGCTVVPDPGESFRDCPDCPELVVIAAGRFRMGAEGGEEGRPEGPVRDVRIRDAFAIGRYEVTQEQFARFVADTGRVLPASCQVWDGQQWRLDGDWTDPGYGGVPLADEPVACVTWQDASDYVRWLTARTGRHYRLPTESEWEYVARAGTTGDYYWGPANEACRHANVYDRKGAAVNGFDWAPFDCDDGYGKAAPVGSFPPNPFGVHDIIGNVWEWTEDCYVAPYPAAPVDGRAVEAAGECERRTARGGSWITRPNRQRASFRGRDPPDTRYSFFGLRVARDLK